MLLTGGFQLPTSEINSLPSQSCDSGIQVSSFTQTCDHLTGTPRSQCPTFLPHVNHSALMESVEEQQRANLFPTACRKSNQSSRNSSALKMSQDSSAVRSSQETSQGFF